MRFNQSLTSLQLIDGMAVTLSPTTPKPFVCFISLRLYSLLQYGTQRYTPSSKHCKCLFHFDYDATFQRLEEQPPHGLLEGNRTTKRGGTCLIDSRESERSRREYTENEVEDEDEEGSCEKENPITTSSSTEKKKKKTQPA